MVNSQQTAPYRSALGLKTGLGIGLGISLWAWWQRQQRRSRRAELKGQVVVITGASSGIGKALAEVLAAEGCRLVLAARRSELLQALAAELAQRHGVETLAVTTDVSDQAQCEALCQQALQHFGQVDIWINNAGVASYAYFAKDELAEMRRVMEINYWGAVYGAKAVLPHMQARRSGLIVNISSVAGKIGQPGIANYSASKHALNGLSNALRIEVARYGVKVLLICPTSTQTEIVAQATHKQAVRFNPEKYFGMSAERVARETLAAIVARQPERVLGAFERLGVHWRHFSPRSFDWSMRQVVGLVFKE